MVSSSLFFLVCANVLIEQIFIRLSVRFTTALLMNPTSVILTLNGWLMSTTGEWLHVAVEAVCIIEVQNLHLVLECLMADLFSNANNRIEAPCQKFPVRFNKDSVDTSSSFRLLVFDHFICLGFLSCWKTWTAFLHTLPWIWFYPNFHTNLPRFPVPSSPTAWYYHHHASLGMKINEMKNQTLGTNNKKITLGTCFVPVCCFFILLLLLLGFFCMLIRAKSYITMHLIFPVCFVQGVF